MGDWKNANQPKGPRKKSFNIGAKRKSGVHSTQWQSGTKQSRDAGEHRKNKFFSMRQLQNGKKQGEDLNKDLQVFDPRHEIINTSIEVGESRREKNDRIHWSEVVSLKGTSAQPIMAAYYLITNPDSILTKYRRHEAKKIIGGKDPEAFIGEALVSTLYFGDKDVIDQRTKEGIVNPVYLSKMFTAHDDDKKRLTNEISKSPEAMDLYNKCQRHEEVDVQYGNIKFQGLKHVRLRSNFAMSKFQDEAKNHKEKLERMLDVFSGGQFSKTEYTRKDQADAIQYYFSLLLDEARKVVKKHTVR